MENERQGRLAIPCARATRGRGLPSLDARTSGNRQVVPPTARGEINHILGFCVYAHCPPFYLGDFLWQQGYSLAHR